MPPASDLNAHRPYLEIWQRALDSPQGIRVKTDNPINLRARLYHARAAERRTNAKIFPEDNVMHGKSYYDSYTVKLEAGAVRIESCEIDIQGVEEL